MWKASAGKDINVDVSNEDDSWETDPDFINDVTGKILSLFIFLYIQSNHSQKFLKNFVVICFLKFGNVWINNNQTRSTMISNSILRKLARNW